MGLICEPLLFALALVDTGSILFVLVYFGHLALCLIIAAGPSDRRGQFKLAISLNDVGIVGNCTVGSRVRLFERSTMLLELKQAMRNKVGSFLDAIDDNVSYWHNHFVLQWVMPKITAHTFLNFMLLIHGQWILALLNIPMTVWLWYEYCNVPQGNLGVFDPTEIHNWGRLKKHTHDCMIYLGYYLIFFFIYLYCMIIALLRGDPINRDDDELVEF